LAEQGHGVLGVLRLFTSIKDSLTELKGG